MIAGSDEDMLANVGYQERQILKHCIGGSAIRSPGCRRERDKFAGASPGRFRKLNAGGPDVIMQVIPPILREHVDISQA
jgi:hypothetical protein